MIEWKNIAGTYWINNLGQVFNSNYHNTGEWKELKYDYTRNGYKSATISINGKTERFMVHRKVAEYFVPNPDPEIYTCVDHWNDDKTDERAENLHWVTIAENNQKNSKRERLKKSNSGYRHTEETKKKMSASAQGKLRGKDGKIIGKRVKEIAPDGSVKIWDNCKEAAKYYGFSNDTIGKCARGERATAINGRKWEYV